MKKRKTIIWALTIPVAVSVALHFLLAVVLPLDAEIDLAAFTRDAFGRFGIIEIERFGEMQRADGQTRRVQPVDAAEVVTKFSRIASDEPDIPPAAIDIVVQLPPATESGAPALPPPAAVSQWASDGIAAAASKAALLADIELPRKAPRPLKHTQAGMSQLNSGFLAHVTGTSVNTTPEGGDSAPPLRFPPGEITFTDERPAAADVHPKIMPLAQPSAVSLPERRASHGKIPAMALPE